MTEREKERAAVVAWLRGMTASEWNAMMSGRYHLPWAWGVADAIERRAHMKGAGDE